LSDRGDEVADGEISDRPLDTLTDEELCARFRELLAFLGAPTSDLADLLEFGVVNAERKRRGLSCR
jgi:hypothetical protein